MYARVSTIQGLPDQVDEAVRGFRDDPLPFRRAKGFMGNYLLVDRKAGKLVAITLWETQDDLEASASVAAQARQEAAESAGAATPPSVEVYEVTVRP